jgi:membrane-associated phospholipid phosphatase
MTSPQRPNSSVSRIKRRAMALFLTTLMALSPGAYAQSTTSDGNSQTSQPPPDSSVQSFAMGKFAREFFSDESKMWTSPLRVQRSDAKFLLPLAAGAAALFATDRRVSNQVRQTDDLSRPSQIVSFTGSAVPMFGAPISLMALGKVTHNDKTLETGSLSLQAVSHAGLIVQVLKLLAERQRPSQGNGHGAFWRGGSSFPSGHAMTSWAFATVMTHQYPGNHWVQVGSYGFATGVGIARIGGLNHFPSDVLIGSAMGYFIGRYIVRRHSHFQNP